MICASPYFSLHRAPKTTQEQCAADHWKLSPNRLATSAINKYLYLGRKRLLGLHFSAQCLFSRLSFRQQLLPFLNKDDWHVTDIPLTRGLTLGRMVKAKQWEFFSSEVFFVLFFSVFATLGCVDCWHWCVFHPSGQISSDAFWCWLRTVGLNSLQRWASSRSWWRIVPVQVSLSVRLRTGPHSPPPPPPHFHSPPPALLQTLKKGKA